MKIFWKTYSSLLSFISITAIGSLFWIGGLLLLWLLAHVIGIEIDAWAMIGALSTAVAAIAVIGAGLFAYRELAEISSSRHIEVANTLFEELNSIANINARRWVYQNLPEDPNEGIKSISQEGQLAIKQVLNSLDHVSFLTQSSWIPDEIIMPWMHPMIVKSWKKLEPYVLYERQRRNEPYYYEYAEKLAHRCQQWRDLNLLDTEIKWIKDAL